MPAFACDTLRLATILRMPARAWRAGKSCHRSVAGRARVTRKKQPTFQCLASPSTDRRFIEMRRYLWCFLRATDRWHEHWCLGTTSSSRRLPEFLLTRTRTARFCRHGHADFRAEFPYGTVSFVTLKQSEGRRNAMAESTERTINKHIRVLPEQWERIERAAQGTALTANQIVIELAIEALDRRDWPKTEAEVRVARASLFAAQAIARDLIAAGRENEVEEIREFISTIVPDPDQTPPMAGDESTSTGSLRHRTA